MRRKIVWCAGVVAVLAAGIRLDTTAGVSLIGASPAEAKDYYTKKRVHGRWISGRFPKKSASRSSAEERAETVHHAARAEAKAVAPAAPATQSRAPASVPGGPGPGTQPSAAPLSAPMQPAASAVVPAAAAAATAAEAQRLEKLRQALQARANALTTGSVAPQLPARSAPEPQSVSLDFQSGIKTTLFSDGTMVREPFDVVALKSLAAVPAQAKGGQ